jgi:CYTH domain-containing protein
MIQSYYVAKDGYNLRVRVQTDKLKLSMTSDTSAVGILNKYGSAFDKAWVTIKGPMNTGTRYEAEREIDPIVAVELIKAAGNKIIKNRHSAWIGNDGWAVDIFGGDNFPLIVAECERLSPVVNLQIPAFCITEITDDWRFANDSLSSKPYPTWSQEFKNELQETGPAFLSGFGENERI